MFICKNLLHSFFPHQLEGQKKMGLVKEEEKGVGKTTHAGESNGKETVSFRSYKEIEKWYR